MEPIALVNFVIVVSNGLTQMVNFPTHIPDCDSHIPALLDLFLSSDVVLFCKAFPPLQNFDHVVISVSVDFPSNSIPYAAFHHIAYEYSRCD